MKKLAVFIYSMAGGGAERVVSNLLSELVGRYEIYLILMNDRIAYPIPHDVKIYYLENSNPFENGLIKFAKLPFLALKYKPHSQVSGRFYQAEPFYRQWWASFQRYLRGSLHQQYQGRFEYLQYRHR